MKDPKALEVKRDEDSLEWVVECRSTWVAPSSRLQLPVPCTAARYLSLDFSVLSGTCCDFDIWFEHDNNKEGTLLLYGPSRRTKGVKTCVQLPASGTAHITFDNFASWLTSVEVTYTVRLTVDEPADSQTVSRLLRGRTMVAGVQGVNDCSSTDAERAEDDLDDQPMTELRVAAGEVETIEHEVTTGERVVVSFDVVQGRFSR